MVMNLMDILQQDFPYKREFLVAFEAIETACAKCEAISLQGQENTAIKVDGSPVTQADFAAQLIIQGAIMENFSPDTIIAEEDLSELSSKLPFNPVRRSPRRHGHIKRWWAIDPIDGTKGYIAGRQYCCCVALIEDGDVKMGILGCPRLDGGRIFWAVRGGGSFTCALAEPNRHYRIPCLCDDASSISSSEPPTKAPVVIQSVDAGHTDLTLAQLVAERLGIISVIQMDSQCKYSMVARNTAHIYIRRAIRRGYREKIWDHAPGMLIVQEAGGIVTDFAGNQLKIQPDEHITVVEGIVATNLPPNYGINHQTVLAAINECMQEWQ